MSDERDGPLHRMANRAGAGILAGVVIAIVGIVFFKLAFIWTWFAAIGIALILIGLALIGAI